MIHFFILVRFESLLRPGKTVPWFMSALGGIWPSAVTAKQRGHGDLGLGLTSEHALSS